MVVMSVAVVARLRHEGRRIRLPVGNSLSLRGRVGVGASLVTDMAMLILILTPMPLCRGMMVMFVAVVARLRREGRRIRLPMGNSLSLRGRVGVGASLVSDMAMLILILTPMPLCRGMMVMSVALMRRG